MVNYFEEMVVGLMDNHFIVTHKPHNHGDYE
jgi:hypothetical protein